MSTPSSTIVSLWDTARRKFGLAGISAVVAILAASAVWVGLGARAAIPFPIPVYEIEATSGGHTASLLNLPLGQPGALQAPIPVDVDGDLLPDITVAVNLVNAEGVLNNPPQVGQVIAPNIEITRLETATLLGQISPPVRVNVKFTVTDLQGQEPDTIVRFGYDTGEGGSIPQEFKALVGGLDNFFNPIEAVIDTTGGILGLDPGINELGLTPVSSSYEGPLTIIAGLESGDTVADIGLEYAPFPDAVRVTFGWDDSGQHITYAHQRFDEVDLLTKLDFTDGASTVDFDAHIDRLPRSIAVDLFQDQTRGALDWQARSDERLPDIRADLRLTSPGQFPVNASLDIEDLPRQMHAEWETDPLAPSASFVGSGNGIGAIEAYITTFDGDPTVLVPYVPTEQQYVNLQLAPGAVAGDEIIAGARLERIRSVTFEQADDGLHAVVDTGDGQFPLEVHADLDLRASGNPKMQALATIAPLPDLIELAIDAAEPGDASQPFTVTYDASSPVDIDTAVDLLLPTAALDAVCGDPGTLCATFDARHIPPHLRARVIEVSPTENRILVDVDGDPGAAKPDFFAHVVLGQDDGVPLVADASLEGLARDLSIRTVQGADETLEKFEFHTCDRDYDANGGSGACVPGTEDEIGLVQFSIANFLERPDGLPAPKALAPNRATVTGRGMPNPADPSSEVVLFEATGRIESIEKVQYSNIADVFGIATTIGDGQDLEIDLDLADIDFDGDDPSNGRVDVLANALISPLPDNISFCFADAGRINSGPTDAVTALCEGTDPFGDGAEPNLAPMVVNYTADSVFDLDFFANLHLEGLDESSVVDDTDIGATLDLDNVPNVVDVVVDPATDSTPLRALITAPGAPDFDIAATASYTTGGTHCADPRPTSPGADVIVACLDALVQGLPSAVSVFADTTTPDHTAVVVEACDLDPVTLVCRDTASQLDVLQVGARLVIGEPRFVDHYAPSEDQYAFALADLPGPDDLELRAGIRLEDIRGIRFAQTPDGFEVISNIGSTLPKPLEVHAAADARNFALTEGLRAVADVLVDPLPSTITIEQQAPGPDQSTQPLRFLFDTNPITNPADAVDIDVHAMISEAAAAAGAECGDAHTVCADLDLDRLPKTIEARVGEVESTNGADLVSDTLIEVDATPHAGVAKPDLVVDAVMGPNAFGINTGTDLIDGKPIVGHVELFGLPTVVRATMQERTVDDGVNDPSTQLEKVEIHTCLLSDLAADGLCAAPDPLDEVVVNLRNFLKRPNEFPPPTPTTPLYVTLTGRDTNFETETRWLDLSDAVYVNYGDELGVGAAIGGTNDFEVKVDVKDFAIGDLDLADLALEDAAVDLDAVARILPLPGRATFCLRNGGLSPIPAARGGVLTNCENADPFGDGASLDHTPLSVVYEANSDLDVETYVKAVINGTDTATDAAIAPRTIRGVLNISDIPHKITTHLLLPPDATTGLSGPVRLLYDTETDGDDLMSIHTEALYAVGDAVCEDPRPTAESICVNADINNLPARVVATWDPTVEEDNLLVETFNTLGNPPTATEQLAFENLLFASVKPTSDPTVAEIMVIEGEILGLPHTISGSLSFPDNPDDPPSIRVLADPPIAAINATFRNFIAPDPYPFPAPNQRAGLEQPTQTFTVFQRGDALKAEVHIEQLKGGGFETLRNTDGGATDTSVISVDFGGNETVRAYADLMPSAATRTIGDVTIEDMPSGITVCFRGAKTSTVPAAVANFCDQADADSGAFQFRGDSIPDNDDNDFSVHAFIRQASSGGVDILSGDVSLIGIPPIIQGTFPSDDGGDLDIGMFSNDGVTPNGIDEIRFNLATFDVTTHGYGADIPYQVRTLTGGPFPVPTSTNQYASAGVDTSGGGSGEFQVRGRLGDSVPPIAPNSRLQRIRMLDNACPLPANNPPDYPHFPPADDDTSYQCIRVDLEQAGPAGDDPFDLHVDVVDEDTRLRLSDAGLTNLPSYIQMTIADTPTLESDGGFRRRCGFHSNSSFTGNRESAGTTDCMAPLLRFDQPDDVTLFGVVEYGAIGDLAALPAIQPREALANLDESPNANSGNFWTGWGADPTGVRAKIGVFGEEDDSRVAAKVGVRLDIPKSLQVDQIQSWSGSDRNGKTQYWDGSDMRFHFIVRDDEGQTIPRLGELTAMLHMASDGTQILLSQPRFDHDPAVESADPNGSGALGSVATPDSSGYTRGIDIPAEVGIDLYQRNHKGDGSSLLQIDGILSEEFDLGARILGGAGFAVGRAEAQVTDLPGRRNNFNQASDNLEEPSFRFRVHMLSNGAAPPTGGGGTGGDDEDDSGGSDCSIFFCARTQVDFDEAFVALDFDPNDDNIGARQVDTVINTRDGKQGVEVKSWDTIGGNNANLIGISAHARIDVDPINVFIHAGIPIIGGADFVLLSNLQAGFSLNNVHDLQLRHNLLHMKVTSSGGTTKIGPIFYNVNLLHGSAWLLFVKLFGIDLIPPGPPPVLIGFRPCAFPLIATSYYGRTINNTTDNFVIDPLADPRLFFSGVIGGPLNFIKSFISPFFCLTDVGDSDIPLINGGFPTDPVGTARAVAHAVPGTGYTGDSGYTSTPEPDLTPPDFTLSSGTLALCGTHVFDELTIAAGATLNVASALSSTDSTNTGEDCPAPGDGEDPTVNQLSITARVITVNGSIDGSSVINTLGATANSMAGAGHGGAGGAGPNGGTGATYGDTSLSSYVTESGKRGSGDNGYGRGGQALVLNAELIDNNGTITVAGEAGRNRSDIGACDVYSGDPPAVTTENTGVSGWGGGSGGGLIIVATKVENSGTITANGGAGGAGKNGGGGGGGGGIVKLISPLYSGALPTAAGGAGGANTCAGTDTAPANAGAPGADAAILKDQGPKSQAQSPTKFWYSGSVPVPFSSAAAGGAASDTGIRTALCSLHVSTATFQNAPDGTPLNDLFVMPQFGPTVEDPCGYNMLGGFIKQTVAPKAIRVDDTDQVLYSPPGTINTMTATGLAEGFEGFWTIAIVPQTADNDCGNPFDGPGGDFDFFNAYNDNSDCLVEANPSEPDLVAGIDNTKPTMFVTSPAENASGDDFQVTTNLIDLTVDAQDQVELSGIERVECSNDGVIWDLATCKNGANQWELTAGDGAKNVHVRAFDRAGNQNENVIVRDGRVDSTPPTFNNPTLSGGTLGSGGWYTSRPGVSFSGYADSGVGAGDVPFVYRFDGGADRECSTAPACAVLASELGDLVVGGHEVEVEAVDALGNTSAAKTLPFKIDDEKPRSALRTVPTLPDGPSGWFATRPWVVISAIDQVGASGVPTTWNGSAGPQYQINGGAWQNYSGPFLLPNGLTSQICFRSEDVAGNVETATPSTNCAGPYRVDAAVPFGDITFDGLTTPAPDGLAGWYQHVPNVDLVAYADAHSGSPAFGEFRYRVDNSSYLDCDNVCDVDSALLTTGHHLVHWAARDLVGNIRIEETYAIDVDTDAPTTGIVVTPPEPGDGSNNWHHTRPWILLDARDQVGASGVASTHYTINGSGVQTYTAPFRLADGVHVICAWAVDRAGNAGPRDNCVTVEVDSVNPDAGAIAAAPNGGGGWYLNPVAVTLANSDATSGINSAYDATLGDLCDPGKADQNPTSPSGVCVSVDGSNFVPWTAAGAVDLGEGVHRLRFFAVDVAGRKSAMVDETYRIDSVAPVVSTRLVPAEANDAGWWRRFPTMILRADDGDGMSSTNQLQYRLDGGPWLDYTRPVLLEDGFIDVDTRTQDVAGNSRLDLDGEVFPIDVHPPVVIPRDPSPLIWSRLLGPKQVKLKWRVTEDLADEVQVYVIIHDATTNVVRRLDAGVHTVTPGVAYDGETLWDGKNQSLTGLVPLGVYYYRVVAIDPAGNMAHSRESRPITIKLL